MASWVMISLLLFVVSVNSLPSALALENYDIRCNNTKATDIAVCGDLTAAYVDYRDIVINFERHSCTNNYNNVTALIVKCQIFIHTYKNSAILKPAWDTVKRYYKSLVTFPPEQGSDSEEINKQTDAARASDEKAKSMDDIAKRIIAEIKNSSLHDANAKKDLNGEPKKEILNNYTSPYKVVAYVLLILSMLIFFIRIIRVYKLCVCGEEATPPYSSFRNEAI